MTQRQFSRRDAVTDGDGDGDDYKSAGPRLLFSIQLLATELL